MEPTNAQLDRFAELAAQVEAFALERDWKQFHTPRNLVLAVMAEVGELAEEFQWIGDPELGIHDRAFTSRVAAEMADIVIYLVNLANVLNIDLMAASFEKLEVNRGRFPTGKEPQSDA